MLFRDGRVLIKQGQLAAGCDKLAASDRLEPMVGTLLNLGDCREKQGKLASAWGAFRRAEAIAKQAGHDAHRQAEAGRRAAALEPKLSTMRIDVASRTDGLVVHRDDELVEAATWNTPVPIDPGGYAVHAEATGYLAWSQRVDVPAGAAHIVVTVPGLMKAPDAAPEPAVRAPAPTPATQAFTYETTRESRTVGPVRGVALGLGIASIGALGTGLYFGLHANTLQDDANRRCPLAVCADPTALHDNQDARTSATRANVLYIAGGAGALASIIMWAAGRPGDETVVRPTFGDHTAGVSFGGKF